ncbi:MAG TPA: YvcK family protein [Bryobacteraceae bacterium]|jgi:uncharacterized cofD-like protein|nr:YvcK family protein [Bryobacteraceae bacterium]
MDALKIVAIGGGTGLSTLLHGLKRYARSPREVEITAIVTVTDDGGSSGRLRRELNILPPGDIRNCMVALSEDEALLSQLFQYRFARGRGLKGHSFGNLFLTALTNLTGDFAQAVKVSSEILASLGRIYPSTAENVTLEAELESGRIVRGETRISRSRSPIRRIRLSPRVCKPLPETLQAIAQADLITFGPGSLFTSLIPNLLVQGIPEAIRRSRALKAFYVNLMWQPGETMGFRASDHVAAINRHVKQPLIDVAIVNTRTISVRQRRKYAAEHAHSVVNDVDLLERMGLEVVTADLLGEGDIVRHDPRVAAEVAVALARRGRAGRQKVHILGELH